MILLKNLRRVERNVCTCSGVAWPPPVLKNLVQTPVGSSHEVVCSGVEEEEEGGYAAAGAVGGFEGGVCPGGCVGGIGGVGELGGVGIILILNSLSSKLNYLLYIYILNIDYCSFNVYKKRLPRLNQGSLEFNRKER